MSYNIGGINLGNLPDYLLFYSNGGTDANWQGATKGFVGDVAVNGLVAAERTSGDVPYAGTLYTNDVTQGAWQAILNQNPTQSSGVTGATSIINGLQSDLISAIQQINALPATPGYTSVASTSLNGLNTQNGINEIFVINITSGLNFSSEINITGDAGDVFILRWDTDGNPSNGYQGQVKPQSGGAIVPHGGLKPSNFINVAGDINSSGGGSNPAPPYPQGPRLNDGQGSLIIGGQDFNGGGFFTGYWLTTGDPTIQDPGSGLWYGETSPLSNGIFVGGWYSLTTKFSMTSGTSGVYVSPNPATFELDFGDAPDTTPGQGPGDYRTLLASDGPRHLINPNLTLGTQITAEVDAYQNANATGDDLGAGIQDDGTTVPLTNMSTTSGNYSLPLKVFNNTGTPANVYAWIDFNKDGIFQTNEGTTAVVPPSPVLQNINLNFTVPYPLPLAPGQTFVRVRLTTQNLINTGGPTSEDTRSYGLAQDGEVEDYALILQEPVQLDFGDAPDTTPGQGPGDYRTLLASDGPRHIIIPNLTLGTQITGEADAYQNANATGDDLGLGIQDDGTTVPLPNMSTTAGSYSLPLKVFNNTGTSANVYAWIDFNKDGIFQTNEGTTAVVPPSPVLQNINLNFTVPYPLPLAPGQTFVRVRLTTENLINTGGLNTEDTRSYGLAQNGEVEDYALILQDTSAPRGILLFD